MNAIAPIVHRAAGSFASGLAVDRAEFSRGQRDGQAGVFAPGHGPDDIDLVFAYLVGHNMGSQLKTLCGERG